MNWGRVHLGPSASFLFVIFVPALVALFALSLAFGIYFAALVFAVLLLFLLALIFYRWSVNSRIEAASSRRYPRLSSLRRRH